MVTKPQMPQRKSKRHSKLYTPDCYDKKVNKDDSEQQCDQRNACHEAMDKDGVKWEST